MKKGTNNNFGASGKVGSPQNSLDCHEKLRFSRNDVKIAVSQ